MSRNILERWLDRESKASQVAQRKAATRRFRPLLQYLEDRLAPAIIAVTTTADVIASDGLTSLREALNQANLTIIEDTITLPAGVYEITIAGAGENANASGDFDITNPVIIKGAAAASTVIDGNALDRVFDILLTANATLTKLTIQNGFASGNGGGIRADDGDLSIKKSLVTNNFAIRGGGINSEDGNVMLKDSTVSDNTANGDGGGLDVLGPGDLSLINSRVTQNAAIGNGGGIFTSTGAAVTLLDSLVSGNVARLSGGGIRSISNVTLTNSIVSDNVARLSGGGIELGGTGTTVTLTNSTVSGNVADGDTGEGGGINTSSGAAVLTNSTVNGNLARAKGGGIQSGSGAVTISNCSVNGNRADLGGGIQADTGAVLLDHSTLSGNVARTNGGGIELGSSDLTVQFSTISGNRAADQGGGIRSGVFGQILVESSTIRGNTAAIDGGGIYTDEIVTLTNSTISNNRVSRNGGGLYVSAFGAANLTNVTISSNLAEDQGGGVFTDGNIDFVNVTITRNAANAGGGAFRNTGNVSVKNTIIAQNLAAAGAASGPDVNGAFTSIGHNLIGIRDGSAGFTDTVLDDQVGTAAVPKNARLNPLADNGGFTLTHALKSDSLAIDAGDNSDAPDADQRGIARPRDGDGNGSLMVDIGAFER